MRAAILFALTRICSNIGVYNLTFAPKFHVGELDTLAHCQSIVVKNQGNLPSRSAGLVAGQSFGSIA